MPAQMLPFEVNAINSKYITFEFSSSMMMLDGRSKQSGFNFMLPRSEPGMFQFRANEIGIMLFHESKPNFSNGSIKSLNFAKGYMECISH